MTAAIPAVPTAPSAPLVGVEWVVEALGCDPDRLRDEPTLRAACDRLLRELELRAVGPGQWHRFPPPGGVTGLYLLTESHLACHTYPEHALATFNLYCCRPRPRWPWEERLGEALGAARVVVRHLERGNLTPQPSPLGAEGLGLAEEPNPPTPFPEKEGGARGHLVSFSPPSSGEGFFVQQPEGRR